MNNLTMCFDAKNGNKVGVCVCLSGFLTVLSPFIMKVSQSSGEISCKTENVCMMSHIDSPIDSWS